MILNLWQKLRKALHRTRSLLGEQVRSLFKGKIDENALESLERLLYEADLGVKTATELTDQIRDLLRTKNHPQEQEVVEVLKTKIHAILAKNPAPAIPAAFPLVILIVGVNGNGKTTTVAKLAKKWHDEGKKVLIAAADTYRAAAVEQLELWAQKIGVQLVKGAPKSDPSAVAYDALEAAKGREADLVLIDTAGRLHTKKDLMQELEKIRRTCAKVVPGSPHETFLVLDATIGQNALDQATTFHRSTPLTGLILTKFDGTAKGGIIVNIQREIGVPVRFIGLGEQLGDLEPFDANQFTHALFD